MNILVNYKIKIKHGLSRITFIRNEANRLNLTDGRQDKSGNIFQKSGVIKSLKEIERVSKSNKSFIQVDSYRTKEEKKIFLNWVLTAFCLILLPYMFILLGKCYDTMFFK